MIPFGPWEPDRSRLEAASGTRQALPHPDGWAPLPSFQGYSTALASACRGAFLARNFDGTYTVFAATATAIYMTSGTSWTDVTRTVGGAYNLADGDSWSMTQFGQTVLFVNVNDAPQAYTLGSSTDFADLTGSPPQCRYVGQQGDYVLLLSTASEPNRIHRSGVNDPTFWTYKRRGSDYQDLPDGGWITGMVGYEKGAVIFSESSIRQFDDLPGSALLFSLTKTEPARGVVAPNSIVPVGNRIFFRAEDGFYEYVPGGSRNLSVNRCEQWFLDEIDLEAIDRVQGAADPERQIVWWRFRSGSADGANSNYSDRLIGYNWALDRWFDAGNVNLEWILSVATPGYTLEELESVLGYTNLDTNPYSLDSRIWKGGRPTLGAFSTNHALGFFEGSNRLATVQTPVVKLAADGYRTSITGFRVVGDAPMSGGGLNTTAYPRGRVGTAESMGGTITWGSQSPPVDATPTTDLIYVKASGRVAQIEVIPADTASVWSVVSGVEVPNNCIRQAGRR